MSVVRGGHLFLQVIVAGKAQGGSFSHQEAAVPGGVRFMAQDASSRLGGSMDVGALEGGIIAMALQAEFTGGIALQQMSPFRLVRIMAAQALALAGRSKDEVLLR
jgi:hypothetical protein